MVSTCFTNLIGFESFDQASSFPINDLPLEILVEIFYKLPVKVLYRNKIVCKLWSSLISKPSFGSDFSLRRNTSSTNSPTFTLFLASHDLCDGDIHRHNLTYDGESWSKENKDSFKFLPTGGRRVSDKVDCLASSNGLILCSRTHFLGRCLYYVCNPTTKQWVILPFPPSWGNSALSGLIIFNPSSENPNSKTSRFKVVRLFTSLFVTNGCESGMEIFNSTTNRWKVSNMKFGWNRNNFDEFNAVEHKGILYWEYRIKNVIIAFDSNVNQCYIFPLPGSYDVNVDHKLGVSQNGLYYAEIDFRSDYSNPATIWRFVGFEGKHTWVVHRFFDLFDSTLQLLEPGYKKGINHIDLRESLVLGKVIGIDPVDCNVLYLSLCLCTINGYQNSIYSVDTGRRQLKKLTYTNYVSWSFMFVQPSWPTTIPKLPPSANDNLYNDTHPYIVCGLCGK